MIRTLLIVSQQALKCNTHAQTVIAIPLFPTSGAEQLVDETEHGQISRNRNCPLFQSRRRSEKALGTKMKASMIRHTNPHARLQFSELGRVHCVGYEGWSS